MNWLTKLGVSVLALTCGAAAQAHSGGTDTNGCHTDSKTGIRHCHTTTTVQPPVTQPVVTVPVVTVPVVVTPPLTAVKPPPAACQPVTLSRVVDGDTIHVFRAGSLEKIRINQIDAPESSQAYGRAATSCLSNLVTGTSLQICPDGKDKYGRTIAAVKANGSDIGQAMVSQGCAWAYTKYLEAGSNLPALQAQAQAAQRGLWAGGAQPPWEYRSGTQPITVAPATGLPAVATSTTTTAKVYDRVFDWAEHQFTDLLTGGTNNQDLYDGTIYRCYTSNFCLGYRNGRFLTYDGKTLSDVGGESELLPVIQAAGF